MSVCVCCVLARVESMMGMSFLLSYNMLLLPNTANACDADIIATCLSFQRTGKKMFERLRRIIAIDVHIQVRMGLVSDGMTRCCE